MQNTDPYMKHWAVDQVLLLFSLTFLVIFYSWISKLYFIDSQRELTTFFIAQIAEIVEQFGGRVHINNLWKFIYYCFVEFGNCLVFLGVSEKGRGKIERGGFFGDFISIVLIFYCSSGKKANGILRYIFSITNERSKQHEESCTNT